MGNVNPKLAWTKGNRLLHDARQMLKDVRAAVDPREVAGGIVGLTAGEVLGGAVGGIAGAAVAGPVGAIVGAEVGAFAAGTLGLKFGTDAVRDFAGTPAADGAPPDGQAEATTGSYLKRTSEGRYSQVVEIGRAHV